jgi:hypothetical protein
MTKLAALAVPALIASGAATQARGYTGQADCLVIVDGNLRDRRTCEFTRNTNMPGYRSAEGSWFDES